VKDVGGGTGWNIEQMEKYLSVSSFFHTVYLVDFSPSLCQVARTRFARLGWKNVKVVCQDARTFKLSDYEEGHNDESAFFSIGKSALDESSATDNIGADLLTMSYSLSMIPEFHPVVDSLANLLAPNGIMGVVDFYVQNQIQFQSRNYVGGVIDRHCMWISRIFWAAWFEMDRVFLDSSRRVSVYFSLCLGAVADLYRIILNTSSEVSSRSTPAITSSVSESRITSGSVVPSRPSHP
jgi:betaine lipid synthase